MWHVWFQAVSWWNHLNFNLRKVTKCRVKFLYQEVTNAPESGFLGPFSNLLLHPTRTKIVLSQLPHPNETTGKGPGPFYHSDTAVCWPGWLKVPSAGQGFWPQGWPGGRSSRRALLSRTQSSVILQGLWSWTSQRFSKRPGDSSHWGRSQWKCGGCHAHPRARALIEYVGLLVVLDMQVFISVDTPFSPSWMKCHSIFGPPPVTSKYCTDVNHCELECMKNIKLLVIVWSITFPLLSPPKSVIHFVIECCVTYFFSQFSIVGRKY